MKAKSKPSISLSMVISGYLLAAEARHLSKNTLRDYSTTFQKFQAFAGAETPMAEITHLEIEKFYRAQTVSNKTVLNYYVGLSALWTWAVNEEVVDQQIVHRVERARPEKRAVEPFTEEDIRRILGAITHSRSYTRTGKRESNHAIPNCQYQHVNASHIFT